jgi:FixJ family two-component response regulator
MAYIDTPSEEHVLGCDAAPCNRDLQRSAADPPRALVHIVDPNDDGADLLAALLATKGISSRSYSQLDAFLDAQPLDVPCCLVIHSQPSVIHGIEFHALLQVYSMCPIVLMQEPMAGPEIIAMILAAIDADRQKRLAALRRIELKSRFAALSARERQVMALVAAGKLNKQIAGELGVRENTIKVHRGAAMRKMGARSLADLVRMFDMIAEAVPIREQARSGNSTPARNGAGADRHSGYNPARRETTTLRAAAPHRAHL